MSNSWELLEVFPTVMYWDQRKAYFSPAFQAYIEELIEVERNTSAGLYTPEEG